MTDENLEKRIKAKRLLRDVLGGIVLSGFAATAVIWGYYRGYTKAQEFNAGEKTVAYETGKEEGFAEGKKLGFVEGQGAGEQGASVDVAPGYVGITLDRTDYENGERIGATTYTMTLHNNETAQTICVLRHTFPNILCYMDGSLSGDTPHRNWKFDGIVDGVYTNTANGEELFERETDYAANKEMFDNADKAFAELNARFATPRE